MRFGVRNGVKDGLGWNLRVENCAICKNHLMERCIDCEGQAEARQCARMEGRCGHVMGVGGSVPY